MTTAMSIDNNGDKGDDNDYDDDEKRMNERMTINIIREVSWNQRTKLWKTRIAATMGGVE